MAQKYNHFEQSAGDFHPGDNVLSGDFKPRKGMLFRVLQRKLKPNPEEMKSPIFKTNPAVNRPQVLAPSALESDGMQRLKEKKEQAFHWAKPYPEVDSTKEIGFAFSSSTAKDPNSQSILPSAFSISRKESKDERNRQSVDGLPEPRKRSLTTNGGVGFRAAPGRRASIDVGSLDGRATGPIKVVHVNGLGMTSTPMSSLLALDKEGSDQKTVEANGVSTAKPSMFGVNDFLELYRSRAYSDPRHADANAAMTSLRRGRRYSECLTQSTSSSVSADETTDTIDQKSMHSFRKRNNQIIIAKDVPHTIPENTELSFCESSLSSLSSCNSRPTDGNNNNSPSSGDRWSDGRGGRMGRRFSEPPVPNFQELSLLSSCFSQTKLGHQRRSSLLSERNFSGNYCRPSKRNDFSVSPESLGIDPPLLSRHHLVVWKDKVSTQLLKLPASVEFHDALHEAIAENENTIYAELMRMHRCSDLMPNSSTVVLLDAHIKVITAFFALTQHGLKSAPLWDSVSMRFNGVLTVTDFIRILQLYRNSPEDLKGLEDEEISSWKEKLDTRRDLAYVDSDDSMYDAVRTLAANRIHRLPVFDCVDNGILYFLSYKRILRFICLFINNLPLPSFMNKSIWELKVGTFESIASIGADRPLYEAFDVLISRRVSAIPVIDNQERVINIYSKSDAMSLAENRSYQNLNATVGEVLSANRESFEGVYLCKKTDTLSQIIEWMVRSKTHRLIVVDDERRLEGVVSLSDVVGFIVLDPPTTTTTNVDTGEDNVSGDFQEEFEQTRF